MNRNENREHCERIANELKEIYNGSIVKYDDELYNIWELEEDTKNTPCYLINNEWVSIYDTEIYTLFDYFNDNEIYNIDYILDSYKQLQAVRIMIACGGPNIYINTWDKQVELYWWSDSASYPLNYEICDEINSMFSDEF